MDNDEKSAEEYLQHSKKVQYGLCQSLIERITVKPTDHVFEIGCGTGAFAAYLATDVLQNGRITGCDPDENRIKVAKEKFSDIANLSYVQAGGSEALENKNNVFDVIYSNGVLHWMSDEELEKTLQRSFLAMKNGAVSAHLIVTSVPENMAKLASFLDQKLQDQFHDMLRPIPSQRLVELVQKHGFEVIHKEDLWKASELGSVDEYLTWLDASLYGKFRFKETFYKFQEKIKLETTEDGKIKQTNPLFIIVMKKP